jgi:4-amino-4-deoxy-L-arabinose transferase-like glycosyltransferase
MNDHPVKQSTPTIWMHYILLLVICFFSFFVHISADEVDVMEARNFVSAREMVEDGSWLLPTMNGELRIAKPPLPTWITVGIVMLGGNEENIGLMRIPAAVIATLMVFVVFGFIRTVQQDPDLPLIIASIFAVNVLVIVLGRRNCWDIYAIFFMMIAIWALWHGWSEENASLWPFAAAGISAGLSFLSKGPVAFYSFLLPFFVAYIAAFGVKPIWQKKTGLAAFIAIAVIISSAWPIYVYLNSPEIGLAVAREEVSAWDYDWARPFYYYFNFPLFTGVWIILLAAYFIKPFAKPRVHPFFNYYFPLVWFVAILVLISIIPSKKERYLIPGAVPMSMMAGFLFHSVADRFKRHRQVSTDVLLVNIHTILMTVMAVTIPVVYYFLQKDVPQTSLSWIGTVCIFTLAAVMIYKTGKQKRLPSLFAWTQTFMCLSLLYLWPAISSKDHNNKEFKSILELRQIASTRGIEFYSSSPVNIKVVWDSGQKVRSWNYDKASIPAHKEFILFFGDRSTALMFATDYGEKMSLTIIDEYKWDPVSPRRSIVAAFVKT